MRSTRNPDPGPNTTSKAIRRVGFGHSGVGGFPLLVGFQCISVWSHPKDNPLSVFSCSHLLDKANLLEWVAPLSVKSWASRRDETRRDETRCFFEKA